MRTTISLLLVLTLCASAEAQVSFDNGAKLVCKTTGLICIPSGPLATEIGVGRERIVIEAFPGALVRIELLSPDLKFVGTSARDVTLVTPPAGEVDHLLESGQRGIHLLRVFIGSGPAMPFKVVAFVLSTQYSLISVEHPEPVATGEKAAGDKLQAKITTTAGFAPADAPLPHINEKTAFFPTEDLEVNVQNPSGNALTVAVESVTVGHFKIIALPTDECLTEVPVTVDFTVHETVRLDRVHVMTGNAGSQAQLTWTGEHTTDVFSLTPAIALGASINLSRPDLIPPPPPSQDKADVFRDRTTTTTGVMKIDSFFPNFYRVQNRLFAGVNGFRNGISRGRVQHKTGEGVEVFISARSPLGFLASP